jgi:galactan endo-1,6-beta-galactosidase
VALLAALAPARAQTIVPDPAQSHGQWEGWGTSLCWWAKMLGDRDDIADLLFTLKEVQLNGQRLPGLGLNIARYNAGACSWNAVNGRKMVVSSHILPFRQMEGFWIDGKSQDPNSPSWNWNVDANQRAMLKKARDRGVRWFELFSNSPMWWMCINSNPSGAESGKQDNLSPESYSQFAVYLATIARQAKDRWGIEFTSVEPFNEPSTDYWNAQGKQEGCHFSRKTQAKILPLLRSELDKRGLRQTPIAASDETSYDHAIETWKSFGPETRALVNQVNVHGYQQTGGRRDVLYDLVSKDRKRLWNSEYGEIDGTGLKLAKCLNYDLRFLHPTAWCYWQPFDNKGWGLVKTDVPGKKFQDINPKYYVLAQYTRHIRPGMTLIETGDTETVAAYDKIAHKLVLVLIATQPGQKTIDLSKFAPTAGPTIGPITRWLTEPKKATRHEKRQDVTIQQNQLVVDLPADSVQTLEVEHVIAK